MKLICDGLDLSEAVLTVSKAASTKTTNPILEGIKLVAEDNCLTLIATDLEIAIEKRIKADVKIEGETVVPGRFFSEYIKKLTNEQIELTLNDKNQLSIKYTDSFGTIQCLNSQEFPNIKKVEDQKFFEITKHDLKTLVTKSIFAVATDDCKPILKGCRIEVDDKEKTIKSVALDGYRLALVKKEITNANSAFGITVPARSLVEISKIIDDTDDIVKIHVEKNYLMVDLDDTKIITRLLDGDFVNYNQIIPVNFTTSVVINKNQLEDGLERAGLLSRLGKNNVVKFDIQDKVMILSSKSEIGDIKENITISLNGKDLQIAFNARYFMDAVKAISDEFIKLNFSSAVAPCIITSNETDEFIYLILPVRLV